jgi:hypothetical protein
MVTARTPSQITGLSAANSSRRTQGNSALQAGVGFGAGQSHLEVRARVYAAADPKTPFLSFDSEGASGHLPGAVVAKNPYVAAQPSS